MQFFLILAVVVGVFILMRVSDRLVLPEKLPLYVGIVAVVVFALWWIVTQGR